MNIIVKKFEVISKGNRYIRELYHNGTYAWFLQEDVKDDELVFPVVKRIADQLEAEFRAAWTMTLKDSADDSPIQFHKLSKTKQELLLTCYYAIKCVDDSKVKPLKIDVEEEAAVTTRKLIEIRSGSIDFGVKVNHIDVIDKNIDW